MVIICDVSGQKRGNCGEKCFVGESFDATASEFVTQAMMTKRNILRGARISWQSGAEMREKAVQRGTRSGATRDKKQRTSGAVLEKLSVCGHVENLAFLPSNTLTFFVHQARITPGLDTLLVITIFCHPIAG